MLTCAWSMLADVGWLGVVVVVCYLHCCRRIRGQFDRLSRELNEVAAVAINKKKPLRVSPFCHITGGSGSHPSHPHSTLAACLPLG